MADPGALEVTLLWDVYGNRMVNVVHFNIGNGPDVDQAYADLAVDEVVSHMTGMGEIIGLYTTQHILQDVIVRDIRTPLQAPFSSSTFTPIAGVGSSTEVPPELCLLVTLRTGFGGRSGRGRIYFPGPGDAILSGAHYTSTAEAVLTATSWMGATIDGVAAPLGVYSRTLATIHDVVSAVARSDRPAIQRRRSVRG
jgi:hypothetical protein